MMRIFQAFSTVLTSSSSCLLPCDSQLQHLISSYAHSLASKVLSHDNVQELIGQQGFFSSFCILASLASTGDVGERGINIGLEYYQHIFDKYSTMMMNCCLEPSFSSMSSITNGRGKGRTKLREKHESSPPLHHGDHFPKLSGILSIKCSEVLNTPNIFTFASKISCVHLQGIE